MADSKTIKRRRAKGVPLSTIPKVTLPEPSGHTESLWATLREARNDLDYSQENVADLLKRDFGIEVGKTAVQAWEVGRNEPDIFTYARWARCVGKRLDVQILDASENTQTVHVPAELADAAATVGQLGRAKAAAALAVIEAMLSMSPGEVKALAFDLARRSDD